MFGTGRCMFGSNWPVSKLDLTDPVGEYGRVVGLAEELLGRLTQKDRDDIFYYNAVRFYNLDNV